MKKFLSLFPLLLLLFISCRRHEDFNPVDATPKWNFINENIYYIMHHYYLWKEYSPVQVDLDSFTDPQDLIDHMKFASVDKWSFVIDYSLFEDVFINGDGRDYGIHWNYDSNGEPRLVQVLANSPAGQAGLTRGDKIAYWNPDDGNLTIDNEDGSSNDYTLTSAIYDLNTIVYRTVINTNGFTVGYFVFDQFLRTSGPEITNTFNYFQSQNIDELIIDLRYNGGGAVDTAKILADFIAPSAANGQVFAILKYHDDLSVHDHTYHIDKTGSLELSRVYFLTSAGSASSSELLINGLKPFMSVYTAGVATHGKPVGMNTIPYDDYAIFPIMFRTVNAAGDTDYFYGFSASVAAADDIRYDWGTPEDQMLSAALQAITGQTSPPVTVILTSPPAGAPGMPRSGILPFRRIPPLMYVEGPEL